MSKAIKKIKFRASGVAHLIIGLKEFTVSNQAELEDYFKRRDHAGEIDPTTQKKIGKLTPIMKGKMEALIEKKKSPPSLGEGAKSWIREQWLQKEYGFKKPLFTRELMKGNMLESAAINLLDEIIPAGFRHKNKKHFENEFFRGTPDIDLSKSDDLVEDIKCPWSIKTYFEKDCDEQIKDPIYYGQLQVYMNLTGAKKARLVYCLLNTPPELLEGEKRKFASLFGIYKEDFPFDFEDDYEEAVAKIDSNHNYDHIPNAQKLKYVDIEYNEEYILKLQMCVGLAREYYHTLKL